MSTSFAASDSLAAKSPCSECSRAKRCFAGMLVEGMTESQIQSVGVSRSAVNKGDHLFHAGDPAEHLYVVRGGALKTYVVSPGGDEEVRGFQLADDVAGLDAVCHARFCTSARAISRAWVCRLPIAAVRSRMLESASFRDRVLTALGREFDRLHNMLHRERCTADQRVASFLLSQLNSGSSNDNAIELSMSRADLARHLDLATETVSRVFARLQSRQIVRSEGARCEVIDRSALSALT